MCRVVTQSSIENLWKFSLQEATDDKVYDFTLLPPVCHFSININREWKRNNGKFILYQITNSYYFFFYINDSQIFVSYSLISIEFIII